uniref:LAM_G_DOMAIN domain-containing protein n=1 Tax=Ascaris lumbricoides TaxID=6252 RepID=A0A0M3HSE6_ASCLU
MTHQIEIIVQSLASEPLLVRFWNVDSQETFTYYFGYCGSKIIIVPKGNACAYDKWYFDVYRLLVDRVNAFESKRIVLDGVGCLFFIIGRDLRLRLQQQLWLKVRVAFKPDASTCLQQGKFLGGCN